MPQVSLEQRIATASNKAHEGLEKAIDAFLKQAEGVFTQQELEPLANLKQHFPLYEYPSISMSISAYSQSLAEFKQQLTAQVNALAEQTRQSPFPGLYDRIIYNEEIVTLQALLAQR